MFRGVWGALAGRSSITPMVESSKRVVEIGTGGNKTEIRLNGDMGGPWNLVVDEDGRTQDLAYGVGLDCDWVKILWAGDLVVTAESTLSSRTEVFGTRCGCS